MKNKKNLKIFIYALVGLLLLPTFFYYGTTEYDFQKPIKFNGWQFYNPYEGISGNAYKANLHCHSRGIIEASKKSQSIENLEKIYRSKGYSILAITNHNRITEVNETKKGFLFLPSYEFGCGFNKNHILIIGAKKRSLTYFPFIQNTAQKQTIIDELRDDGQIMSIAHPSRSGYDTEDMKKISGFNCIEVSNSGHSSAKLWDISLSNGKAVWLTAGDDSHDVIGDNRSFRSWMWVFADFLTRDSIISAIRYGRTYAVSGSDAIDKNKLISCSIYDNYLSIRFEVPADTIKLFGQDGKLLWLLTNTNSADYIVKRSERYVRCEAVTKNSTIYLNPIIRIKDTYAPYREIAPIDWAATWLYRSAVFLIHLTVFGLFYFSRKKISLPKLKRK